MSAKYAKKKNRNGKRVVLWVIIALLVILLAAALLVWWALDYSEGLEDPTATPPGTAAVTPGVAEQAPVVDTMQDVTADLGESLQIVNIGAYTGAYVEDGSDEVVSGVLMLVVKNNGQQAIQYAEISLPTENGDAKFTLSTLPAGESVVLLEQNRMEYTGKEDVTQAAASNVAEFSEPMSLQEDKLQLQVLDGALNVVNISGRDIEGDVVIYYKNAASDLYYGGITYRVRLEGGIKAEEIKQIMASHFSDTGSKIMFVTIG